MQPYYKFSSIILVLIFVACASGGSSGGSGSPRSGPNQIDAAELVGPYATMSTYEAIGRLRPTWFRTRAGEDEAMARVDNQNFPLNYLRSLPAEDVATMRYVNRRDATFRFGGRWGGPVIEVTSRRR
ncbi:MAG: hypothetical protein CME30_00740 [Gemmatimonadetes bacterium]|uniref:Uncharacterized protein n=1 Tax=marine metagenome TaxID=408172 RepID=A0A383A3W3_9ZZZZ|nr:hypothetical protein [Gemmatimonadota bacterium]